MAALVKFKPEDLEYFMFHFVSIRIFDNSESTNWQVYLDARGYGMKELGYVAVFLMQSEGKNARIEVTMVADNPAAVIADLRQIFSNFDEITLINEAE